MARLPAFKTYDVRGQLGADIDAELVERIGRAFVRVIGEGRVVIGRDARASSPELAAALARGLSLEGAEVIDLGLCGTEEVYFATDHLGAVGGIMVTASHNPIDHNGLKLVKSGARPLDPDTDLLAIHDLVQAGLPDPEATPGTTRSQDVRPAYVARVLSFIDPAALKPLKIVVNAGNGAAGPTFDAIEALLPRGVIDFVRIAHDPDPSFPHGIPNPLLPENRRLTAEAVLAEGADFGVAWDGDFDRCFFFDEKGGFVDGEYIVGLLAQGILARNPGAKIVHDPRVQWNTQGVVADAGGEAVVSRTGHALIKAKMREVDAVYGGEMSAHHYFRNFMYCDSGMIPFLLVTELVGRSGKSLGDLVAGMRAAFPSSGEINFRLEDADVALARVEEVLAAERPAVDRLDGLSLDFGTWRANIRKSNTEPVLRLNVEARGDTALLEQKVAELTALISA